MSYSWKDSTMVGMYCLIAILLALGQADGVSLRHERSLRDVKPRLKILTIQMEPYISMRFIPGVIGNDRYEGYFIDIIHRLSEDLNFDYQLQLVADGKVGSRTEEEGWNGMIGEILRGTADIALGPVIVTPEREAVVDFTYPVNEVHATIVVAKPRQGTPLTISSVEDLLHQRELKYGVIRGSDIEAAIKSSTDMTYRTLWNKIRMNYLSNTVENIYEGLERMRKERYALIMDSPAAEYHVRQSPCEFVTVGNFLQGRQYAFATQQGSQLTLALNRAIQRLTSDVSGWVRLQEKWWTSNCPGMSSFRELSTGAIQSLNGDYDIESETTTPVPIRRIKVTTFLKAPYVMMGPGGYHGYIVELLDRLSDVVPFEYTLSLVQDGKKFGKWKRGQWDGMIGELIREEADLAAAPFVHHRKHAEILDYTKPFLHSTFSMLIKAPAGGEDLPIYMTEDLLNSTDIEFGVIKKSLTEKQMKSSKDSLYKQLWEKFKTWQGRNTFNNLEQGLTRVRQGKFALLLESTDGAYVSSKQPCDLILLDEFLSVTNYMFALKKDSTLTEDVNHALMVLQQDSVLQMLYHKWLNSDECLGVTDDGVFFGSNPVAPSNEEEDYREGIHLQVVTPTLPPLNAGQEEEHIIEGDSFDEETPAVIPSPEEDIPTQDVETALEEEEREDYEHESIGEMPPEEEEKNEDEEREERIFAEDSHEEHDSYIREKIIREDYQPEVIPGSETDKDSGSVWLNANFEDQHITSFNSTDVKNTTDNETIDINVSPTLNATTESSFTGDVSAEYFSSTIPEVHPTRRHRKKKGKGRRRKKKNRHNSTTTAVPTKSILNPVSDINVNSDVEPSQPHLPSHSSTTSLSSTTLTPSTTRMMPSWSLQVIDFGSFLSTPARENHDDFRYDDDSFRYDVDRTSWNPVFVDVPLDSTTQKKRKTTTPSITTTTHEPPAPTTTTKRKRIKPSKERTTTSLPPNTNPTPKIYPTIYKKDPDDIEREKDKTENEAESKERNTASSKGSKGTPLEKAVICIVLFFLSFQ